MTVDMLEELRNAAGRVVGLKQLMRELDKKRVDVVYLASDADAAIKSSVQDAARKAGAQVIIADSMERLGQVCGIEVSAACAGIIPQRYMKEESSKG